MQRVRPLWSGWSGLAPARPSHERERDAGRLRLILATTVIAVSQETASPWRRRHRRRVMVVALVFWFAHIYASLLGIAVSDERRPTRAEAAQALRRNWSLVEVTVPLVLMLALGAIGVISDRAALVAGNDHRAGGVDGSGRLRGRPSSAARPEPSSRPPSPSPWERWSCSQGARPLRQESEGTMNTPERSKWSATGDGTRAPAGAERSGARLPSPHRGLRVPVELPYRRARGARRVGRLALRSALRLAERVRRAARSPGRLFRLGPFGVNVPTARAYEPGTNVLSTTWNAPGGWILVRDALTMGPRRGEDVITPHTRPPADDDGDHLLVRDGSLPGGSVEIDWCASRCSTTGAHRRIGRWSAVAARRPTPAGPGRRSGSRPTWRSASRADVRARHTLGRASRSTARFRGLRASPRRRASTRPTPVSPPRRASGAPGWRGPDPSTTAGGSTSSVPH